MMRALLLAVCFFAPLLPGRAGAAEPEKGGRVRSLRVQVLSTMLADAGIGEWGFAALVEADGHRILFDTGAHPETVLRNARELGVDLATVPEVVLSHHHADHTGGLLTLRRRLVRDSRESLARVHVAKGIFLPRPGQGGDGNPMATLRPAFEGTGGTFVEHGDVTELYPGIYLTGPVPRTYPEHNYAPGKLQTDKGVVEDTVPEDQSLVFDTAQGLVLLSGCGHAGIVNTIEYARRKIRPAAVHAALGGFHLYAAGDKDLGWTIGKLRQFGVKHFLGAHCTGIEAVFRVRQGVGLARPACVVGSVGSSFSLKDGIDPLRIAR